VLPIGFCGAPDRVVEQIRKCREVVGTGVLDISLTDPGTDSLDAMMDSLSLFGREVLPRVRDI
jgi:alkanesulfonate monooxygenase SsuD/methylene tetrahydromethanopterin reductase-like flavin-dependent oxidoreductase (luciferase family)